MESREGACRRGALVAASLVLAISLAACGSSGSPSPPAAGPGGALHCVRAPGCLAPRQFRVAYGLEPLLDRGIDGRGRTVVILDPAPSPSAGPPGGVTDINQDLAHYDQRFGLPAAHLDVVSRVAASASPWLASSEEVLDVEMVHAVAPGAAIRVVLIGAPVTVPGTTAPSSFLDAIPDAVRSVVDQDLGDVISISASSGEHCFTQAQVDTLHAVLRAARDHHVSVVGSSGDFGAVSRGCRRAGIAFTPVKEVGLPASDPLVTATGGTTLQADRVTGTYVSETVWNPPALVGRPPHSIASGGGFSSRFAQPAYQNGVRAAAGGRGVPDVAADADVASGLAIVAQIRGSTRTVAGSGTSASAPLWAAVAVLADQYAGRRLGFLNAALYRIGRSPQYSQAFHDTTTGTNTVTFPPQPVVGYPAGAGWDPVTGWGSPDAHILVPLLAREAHPDDGRDL